MRFLTSALVITGIGLSVSRADDTVVIREKGKEKPTTLVGRINEETLAGIKFTPKGGATRDISVADLVDVIYESPADVRLGPYPKARELDSKGPVDAAIKQYEELLPSLLPNTPIRKHVEFRIASLKAQATEAEAAKIPQGIEILQNYLKDNSSTWQAILAVKQVGRLQMARGDFEGASKTFDDFSKAAGLGPIDKQEMTMLAIDALMQAKKFSAASEKIRAALSGAEGDQKDRLEIYQIGCSAKPDQVQGTIDKLQSKIKTTSNPALKAVAFNTIGDCYMMVRKPEDAKWAYLWVDVIYNQDRLEHAKALDRLAKLFKEIGDEGRAEEFQQKLARLR